MNTDTKKLIRMSAEFAALYGIKRMLYALYPIQCGLPTRIACEIASFSLLIAIEPTVEKSVLKCEQVLQDMVNGNGKMIPM